MPACIPIYISTTWRKRLGYFCGYLWDCFCQRKEIWLHTCRNFFSRAPQNKSRRDDEEGGGGGFLRHTHSLRPSTALCIREGVVWWPKVFVCSGKGNCYSHKEGGGRGSGHFYISNLLVHLSRNSIRMGDRHQTAYMWRRQICENVANFIIYASGISLSL